MTAPADNPVVSFGSFIRARRLSLEISARAVAAEAGMQPSNLSNLEHGLLKPPQDPIKLTRLGEALKLAVGTEEFVIFADLAAKANNSIPADIAQMITEDEAIPLMLRSFGNKKLSKADIAKIVALVRDSH